ncbi:MAG TPA: deoxynucleoside kinase [Cytophagales bacterium]|jgi:deoxyadenosine/deoxycytidine kinase|nr:deoxynucleoside kinase [Cytophagales bacterium]
MKLKHIVISGNIGVGKTTLAEKLAKKYNWKILLEEVDNNPYLDDFYKSMKNWSFHLQIFFLNSRFKQIQNISKTNSTIIQDRSIYEDYEVFTKNLFDSGILLKREFENYKRLYNTILEYVKVPDLLIYIRNKNINNIVNNIKKRNRKFEKNINTEYLKNLNNYYENWIKHYSNKNLLIIDVTNKDFIKNSKDLKNIYNIIETKINELT